ncbi:MAG TPA: hypothetical protein VEL79_15870 [Vicinamibacterales bacterium]|nr:hypothetical protein [Vicinamibacterales bacterium]
MRRGIAACVVLGLVLRIAFALLYWTHQPLTRDEREYLALARSIARGDGFRYPADEPPAGTGQQFGRAPGYPVFLAVLRVTEPVAHVPRRVQLAQSIVGAIGVWLIAAIATRAAGSRAGIAAAAIAAVYPPLVTLPAYALTETLYSTVALGAALLLEKRGSRVEHRGSSIGGQLVLDSRPSILGGLLTGIGILIRPVMAFFVPMAVAWMLWRRRPADAAVFLLVAALCVIPWTLRNHRVYGRWIAVASEGGVTFWTGNHPLARGDGDLAANPELKRAELTFRAAHPGLTPEQLEPLYYGDALQWIRTHPLQWTGLLTRKVFYTIVPIGTSYTLHSARYMAASAVPYLLLLPAAVAGAWRWRLRRPAGAVSPAPLWLMAAATVAAGLAFLPQERFRLPVIDPALIVTSALLAGLRRDEPTRRHANV